MFDPIAILLLFVCMTASLVLIIIDFDPSLVWNVEATPFRRSSSELPEMESFLTLSFVLSSEVLLLITIFLDDNKDEVVTAAEDDALLWLIPTLIKDTFPADWARASLDVASLEPDVPG